MTNVINKGKDGKSLLNFGESINDIKRLVEPDESRKDKAITVGAMVAPLIMPVGIATLYPYVKRRIKGRSNTDYPVLDKVFKQ